MPILNYRCDEPRISSSLQTRSGACHMWQWRFEEDLFIQSPKIIMTGLKLIPLAFSFEINPWGQLQDVLIHISWDVEDSISLS